MVLFTFAVMFALGFTVLFRFGTLVGVEDHIDLRLRAFTNREVGFPMVRPTSKRLVLLAFFHEDLADLRDLFSAKREPVRHRSHALVDPCFASLDSQGRRSLPLCRGEHRVDPRVLVRMQNTQRFPNFSCLVGLAQRLALCLAVRENLADLLRLHVRQTEVCGHTLDLLLGIPVPSSTVRLATVPLVALRIRASLLSGFGSAIRRFPTVGDEWQNNGRDGKRGAEDEVVHRDSLSKLRASRIQTLRI